MCNDYVKRYNNVVGGNVLKKWVYVVERSHEILQTNHKLQLQPPTCELNYSIHSGRRIKAGRVRLESLV